MSVLFGILFFMVFGKMIGLAFRATWGIFKIMLYIVFLPLFLLALVFGGLMYLALPILIAVGVISLIAGAVD
ncbi:hypothetical protein SAMN02910377_01526 [Pseudobutyrivibrio ruminis]|jgi:hypothetical protein|uniref:Uncharacterized protein n=2 Tax=Pseudobutyrivibrio ruminis TaxID=46206 RepID=A0A1H7J347_9FIRM|nr:MULTISPECIES: hypothetical protein [Pseudobutyrivibrio]MBE5913904.1 hypothetical protein [Pseudobutyrivibrio ruminis]SEK67545.1 hypothetical protein SAMN02910377_01526 [Pseudobutyrivibrio ruminis]SES78259.1 hypothetical protein SAMN02910413_0880 [Pseudobutyrivibrio sp. C4]SOB96847.1 hypothetical protein SAMN02910411_1194 [Pseudobutyrivibrio ruminis DSM 9787]